MLRIVFICTGNTCRSPMAEIMLRSRLAQKGIENVSVRSAGLFAHPGAPMSYGTVCELEKRGMAFFRNRAVRLSMQEDMISGATVLCMSAWQMEHVIKIGTAALVDTVNHYAGLPGDIDDPYGGGENAYRRTAEQIEKAVCLIVERIERDRKNDPI